MSTSTTALHPTWTTPFEKRAVLPNISPLASYLLRLIALKKTNLCLSADVTTSTELINLAEEVGGSICILKTHADIISDFSDRTVRRLRDVAQRKNFLIFEDRKFGDIGSTVQKQYTSGPLQIAKWAEITNAHIFPGPAIVTALKAAAADTINAYNSGVSTEISVGTPAMDSAHEDCEDYTQVEKVRRDGGQGQDEQPPTSSSPGGQPDGERSAQGLRKGSIVSISTTISQRADPISPRPDQYNDGSVDRDGTGPLEQLGPAPYLRALLLLAEMSSAGNLLTGAYTEQCIEIAREHRDFVMGFIAQRSLNTRPEDNFVVMTPGVSLPPEGQEDHFVRGDDLGQQYNTPRDVVYEKGCDVVIVGRGILKADNPGEEAERYRIEAWKAYEARIGGSP